MTGNEQTEAGARLQAALAQGAASAAQRRWRRVRCPAPTDRGPCGMDNRVLRLVAPLLGRSQCLLQVPERDFWPWCSRPTPPRVRGGTQTRW